MIRLFTRVLGSLESAALNPEMGAGLDVHLESLPIGTAGPGLDQAGDLVACDFNLHVIERVPVQGS